MKGIEILAQQSPQQIRVREHLRIHTEFSVAQSFSHDGPTLDFLFHHELVVCTV